MTISSFRASLSAIPAPLPPRSRPAARHSLRQSATMPLLLAAALVLLAVGLAPEQPRAQEAICHRHNGVEACRVW